MNQCILLPNEMFQDDTDINCYNLLVSTENGVQHWDVDIFSKRYPRIGKMLKSQFEAGVLSFDVRRLINLSLV